VSTRGGTAPGSASIAEAAVERPRELASSLPGGAGKLRYSEPPESGDFNHPRNGSQGDESGDRGTRGQYPADAGDDCVTPMPAAERSSKPPPGLLPQLCAADPHSAYVAD